MTNPIRTQCFVNGAWVGNGSIAVTNPATDQELAKVPNFGFDETNEAIAVAKVAFGSWSKTLAKERSQILRRWYDLLVEHADELAHILTSEQGKPLAEAKGEILYAASFIEFYAEEAKRIYGETIPSHIQDGRIIVTRQPIGVVAAITPWNFPAAMITRKVGPALAAGCTCVVKPAMETPLTAFALAQLGQKAGLPDGVLNVITGDSKEIGKALCDSPDVRTLTFTGSTPVGKLLMQQCASTVKKLGLELGGNAPFIVFDDADLDAAVVGAMASKFRNAGQTCVCANRIYVHDAVYDAFAEKLATAVRALKVGNGQDAATTQGPLITENAVQKVEEHIADAVSKGASTIEGGQRHEMGGTFFQPTVLRDVTQSMVIAKEETFGPIAPLFRFKADNEVIAMANDTEFGLAAYFYSRDIGRVWRVAEQLEYGMVAINSGMLSTEVAPFGGVKESGIGREGSSHGMDEFTEIKYMLMAGL
ncbi:NAD-dependent succinate-semialdehyde dehydrogenase [Amylibacter sp. SFDW26]|uniref:NAD-dependent succinate-semialdehyde dehydrogenase n=1 Tax=Amylibacter sp. SFDW26 TaxID=2652722 RepID=UPI00126178E4|nr:NAD-dependent succinate-semialdehyde dehydrogenase [Amylibacter sp. SFDW26]KAB7613388.1 NAD-dependent succinate-semialdehyde dehydrogenase [Amylibacter sp. SFDW26]